MDAMKAPEQRNPMREDVPKVERVVHKGAADHEARRARQAEPVEQAPAPTRRQRGERRHARCLRESNGQSRRGGESKIAQIAFGRG
jgi:hypothetical protein